MKVGLLPDMKLTLLLIWPVKLFDSFLLCGGAFAFLKLTTVLPNIFE